MIPVMWWSLDNGFQLHCRWYVILGFSWSLIDCFGTLPSARISYLFFFLTHKYTIWMWSNINLIIMPLSKNFNLIFLGKRRLVPLPFILLIWFQISWVKPKSKSDKLRYKTEIFRDNDSVYCFTICTAGHADYR